MCSHRERARAHSIRPTRSLREWRKTEEVKNTSNKLLFLNEIILLAVDRMRCITYISPIDRPIGRSMMSMYVQQRNYWKIQNGYWKNECEFMIWTLRKSSNAPPTTDSRRSERGPRMQLNEVAWWGQKEKGRQSIVVYRWSRIAALAVRCSFH